MVENVRSGRHVYDRGLIGNCSYMAQINSRGDVVWMCWPRFDSSFVFGSSLDEQKGGHFSIVAKDFESSKQYYIENTNVLCTEVETGEGRFRITLILRHDLNFTTGIFVL